MTTENQKLWFVDCDYKSDSEACYLRDWFAVGKNKQEAWTNFLERSGYSSTEGKFTNKKIRIAP